MEIVWLGHSCFRLKSGDLVLLTDPYGPDLGYNLGKPTANVVTISRHHSHHNYLAGVGGPAKGTTRVIDGPGEYEIGGVFITGIQTWHRAEGSKRAERNTIYTVEMEDLVVCHLGDLDRVPAAEEAEQVGGVDVLLVPVGGQDTINASQASEVISLLEPKIVIPMHYKTDAVKIELDPIDRFCRQMGIKNFERQSRLLVAKGRLPAEMDVVFLEYRKG
ncbi:MAG TPA: MBL fold metallo-hydrolase [Dehalococcoidia bacterium]|nr:MBL fold metallo-hydrolase [Dehalococcoidia bacterium]